MIAHLEIDSFFTAVERMTDGGLRDRPIVIGGESASPGFVVAASIEARRCGVAIGMRIREAARICPTAAFRAGSVARYVEASAAMDAVARRAGAAAEWTSVDEAYLDLRGAQTSGAAPRMVETIQRRIETELGFSAAVGVASTKIVARVASRLVRPAGFLYVLPGYEARFLDPLPVARLLGDEEGDERRGAATCSFLTTLREHGCATVGEAVRLAASPPPDHANAAASFVDLLRGRDDRPVLARPAPRAMQAVIELPERGVRGDGDAIDRSLDRAAADLAQRLADDGLLATTITVTVIDEARETVARSCAVPDPTSQAVHLAPLVRRVFRRAAARRLVVSSASVSCSVTPQVDAQLTLFERPVEGASDRRTA